MRRILMLLALMISVMGCMLSDDIAGMMLDPDIDAPPIIEGDDFSELNGLIRTLPVNRAEDGAFTLGYPEAPVTIIIFEDWLCPHCQTYKPTVDQLITTYVATGQARYERRVLPTAGGDTTRYLGQLIECAAEQGANYFVANNELYRIAIEGQWGRSLPVLAERMGLNEQKLVECTETADQVDIDLRFASQLGVSSTPSILIRYGDGRIEAVVDRSFDGLRRLIEGEGGAGGQA